MRKKPDQPSLPQTEQQLRAWLRDTKRGQDLLRDAASKLLEEACRECQRPYRPRPRVLVVSRRLLALPGVEVFWETGANVRLEELVDTRDDPVIEEMAEELLVAQLPRTWKHVLNCRRESVVFRGLRATRRLESLLESWWLRELRKERAGGR